MVPCAGSLQDSTVAAAASRCPAFSWEPCFPSDSRPYSIIPHNLPMARILLIGVVSPSVPTIADLQCFSVTSLPLPIASLNNLPIHL